MHMISGTSSPLWEVSSGRLGTVRTAAVCITARALGSRRVEDHGVRHAGLPAHRAPACWCERLPCQLPQAMAKLPRRAIDADDRSVAQLMHTYHGSSVTPSMALRDGGKVIEPWPAASPSPADATAAAAAARTRAEAPVVHMVCKFNCAITLRLRTPPEFTGQSQATAAGRGVRGRECARCRLMSVVGANVGLLAAPRACAHTCTWICAAHARAHACRVRGLPAGPGAPTTLGAIAAGVPFTIAYLYSCVHRPGQPEPSWVSLKLSCSLKLKLILDLMMMLWMWQVWPGALPPPDRTAGA